MRILLHALHYLLLLGGAAVVLVLLVAPGGVQRLVDRRRSRASGVRRPTLVPVLAMASLGASAVHALAAPAHAREGLLLGAFFVGAALLQLAWAVGVLRSPGSGLLLMGALGNAAVVLLWAWTRTRGIPFGLAEDAPEPVTAWDLLATVLEVAVASGCGLALGRALRLTGAGAPRTWSRPAQGGSLVLGLALVLLTTTGLPG